MANYISISFHMLLCLLFLSSHACNARPFGVQLPTKNSTEGEDTSVLPAGQPSLSKNLVVVADHEPKATEDDFSKIHSKVADDMNIAVRSSNLEAESHESVVVYHVPHKKREDKQPGFNLDYAPPKTHPPVHN